MQIKVFSKWVRIRCRCLQVYGTLWGYGGCVTSDILDHSVPANVHRQVMHFSNCVDIKQEMCISCHLSENYIKVLVNQNCKMQWISYLMSKCKVHLSECVEHALCGPPWGIFMNPLVCCFIENKNHKNHYKLIRRNVGCSLDPHKFSEKW